MARKKKKITSKFEWKPFSKKQLKLLTWWMPNSPYCDWDTIICDGSIRSGKTVAMIDSFIMWSLYTFQGKNFIIAGKSIAALKKNVINPMFEILNAKGIAYEYVKNNDETYIQIGSNRYYPYGAPHERSFEVLRGLTAAGLFIDEASLFPQNFILEAMGRCSIEGAKVWLTTNPDNPSHWLKKDYLDKAEDKKILHLHFTLKDNLSLSKKTIEKYERSYSGLFYQRMILGLWVMAQGVVYDCFDNDIHTINTPKDFPMYFVSCDFGMGNPTVYLLWGIKDKKAYLIREFHYAPKSDLDSGEIRKQKSVGELAQDLKKFLGGIRPECVIIDPSASALKVEIRNLGYTVKNAINDKKDGIVYVQNCLSQGYLYIDKSCKETIKEFMSYVWDEKKQNIGEDEPVKMNDHCMDALRYFLYTYHRPLYKIGLIR